MIQIPQRNINNHPWVDGLHNGSEVTTYFTRYLATVKDRIAILVTFSAHRSIYTKYSKDFISAIESLRVTANKDTLGKAPSIGARKGKESIGQPIPPSPITSDNVPAEGSGGPGRMRQRLG